MRNHDSGRRVPWLTLTYLIQDLAMGPFSVAFHPKPVRYGKSVKKVKQFHSNRNMHFHSALPHKALAQCRQHNINYCPQNKQPHQLLLQHWFIDVFIYYHCHFIAKWMKNNVISQICNTELMHSQTSARLLNLHNLLFMLKSKIRVHCQERGRHAERKHNNHNTFFHVKRHAKIQGWAMLILSTNTNSRTYINMRNLNENNDLKYYDFDIRCS